MGKAAGLIVLPDKLILRIIDIACGIGTVGDRQNIAVIIVGIAISFRCTAGGNAVAAYLGRYRSCGRRRVGVRYLRSCQHRCTQLLSD